MLQTDNPKFPDSHLRNPIIEQIDLVVQELSKVESGKLSWQQAAIQHLTLAKDIAWYEYFPRAFTRTELLGIKERSLHLSMPFDAPIDQSLADAYRQLAFASDRLDAMFARSALRGNDADG